MQKDATAAEIQDTNDETTRRAGGQSGPPLDLPRDRMNENEKLVLAAFTGQGQPTKIATIAGIAFPGYGPAKANSQVRNALRRLVRGGYIEQIGRGLYQITDLARTSA